MALTCSNCGKELPDTASFCLACGTAIIKKAPTQQSVFCDYCGCELPEDAKFCLDCGRPIVEVSAKRERDEAILDELYASSPYRADPFVIHDFEKHKGAVPGRAIRWAQYHVRSRQRITFAR